MPALGSTTPWVTTNPPRGLEQKTDDVSAGARESKVGAFTGDDQSKPIRSRWIVDRPGSNVKAIFTGALDHEPGADRAAYLDAACGDNADLRRRVEALLAARERADEVLGPTGETSIAHMSISEPAMSEAQTRRPNTATGRWNCSRTP
jgi:hypothetical protein